MNPESFFRSELAAWPLAAENFRNIENASAQAVNLTDGEPWRIRKLLVSHRRASITAKTDPHSIAARPCFLCEANRPPEQSAITGHGFQTLVNPYPLARRHYTIASARHEPQRISGHLQEMARLTHEFRDLCVFYNGPLCGASAPDHLHFQAISTEVAAGLTDPRLHWRRLTRQTAASCCAASATRSPIPSSSLIPQTQPPLSAAPPACSTRCHRLSRSRWSMWLW